MFKCFRAWAESVGEFDLQMSSAVAHGELRAEFRDMRQLAKRRFQS